VRHVPVIAAILVAAVLAPVAASADRMWVGFHDDPSLRFDANRASEMDTATATNHASVLRTLVTWADVAPTRPANAGDPFDPAYRFDDLDEFVRNAQLRNAEVLITLWGTPKWANGDKGPNYLPTSLTDFQNFARAVASRYSGRNAGYPFVRFYGIWNESNLGLFLSPQFNARGQIVGPAAYAKLAAAGYAHDDDRMDCAGHLRASPAPCGRQIRRASPTGSFPRTYGIAASGSAQTGPRSAPRREQPRRSQR